MNNRPTKIGMIKPKPAKTAAGSSRQDLKTRLSNHILGGQKRSSSMGVSTSACKRPKLDFRSVAATNPSSGASTSGAVASSSNSSLSGTNSVSTPKLLNTDSSWMEFSGDIEVNPTTFEAAVEAAKEKNKPNRMARTICAAVKSILSTDDPLAQKDFITLVVNVIKDEERLMKSNNVFLSLLSLLNSLNGTQGTLQSNSIIALLTQMSGIMENWPLAMINYVLNDSLGLRNWVDRPNASQLLQCVCLIFGGLTFPSEQSCQACDLVYAQRESFSGQSKFNKPTEDINATTRIIREYFEKQTEPNKNTLKTLALCSRDSKIRVLVAKKLDNWLQNGKLQRQAMELLLYIAANLRDSFLEDNLETLLCLVSLRALRSKLVMNVFQVALKDILMNCPGSCAVLVTVIMDNEFSPLKLQHNMSILQFIYNFNFAESSEMIAKYLIKRLESPDAIKSVRIFLRDFVRSSVRTEFSFLSFAKTMFNVFRELIIQVPQHLQDMLFRAFVDVCAILPFLNITPIIKETIQSKNKSSASTNSSVLQSNTSNLDCLVKYFNQLNGFMLNVLDFLKWSGRLIAVNSTFYLKSYYILLYFGNYSFYTSAENWPLETEFNQFMKVIAECPIEENLLNELIEAGNATPTVQRHSLSFVDVVALLESFTKRALSVRGFENENPILCIKSSSIIDKIFKLCLYQVEDSNLSRPLATRNLYWKIWFLLTVWACMNRNIVLKGLYEKYSILRMVLHMAISRDYQFPPPGLDNLSATRIAEDDERELAYECKIFKGLSTRDALMEDSSSNSGSGQNCGTNPITDTLKIPPICVFNPTGVPRRPANFFVDYLRQCSEQYGLHFVLCSLRSPDILQHLLRDQGAERTLPAVIQMVLNNASLIETAIPLQCLCQLMLVVTQKNLGLKSQTQLDCLPNLSDEIRTQIMNCLRSNILKTNDEKTVQTVINFLLEKCGSPIFDERESSVQLMQNLLMNFKNSSDEDHSMDIDQISCTGETKEIIELSTKSSLSSCSFEIDLLTRICFFDNVKNDICQRLGKCCVVENNAARLLQYIQFISNNANDYVLNNVASRLSSLVKRTIDDSNEYKSVRECLTNFYAFYIRKLENTSNQLNQCNNTSTDELWASNLLLSEHNLLHISITDPKMEFEIDAQIVSAIMELLSEAFCDVQLRDINERNTSEENSREYLMKIFFPKCDSNRQHLTVTKASDHNQIVDILPPHLKMKMLSAHDERIVKVALEGVTSEQALQFIQSFALSSFSCSKLLAILNASELGQNEKALVAVPFVRAYKLKEDEGCSLFLSRMNNLISKSSNPLPPLLLTSSSSSSSSSLPLPSQQQQPSTSMVIEKQVETEKEILRDFSLLNSATEYLNDLLTNISNSSEKDDTTKLYDSKIISSQNFQNFLNALETRICDIQRVNEGVQYAKAITTLIAQKIQIFVQKLPNVLTTILLVLMDVCSKNNVIRSLLTNLSERVERTCPNASFVSSILYRFNSKHLSNSFIGSTSSSKRRGIAEKSKIDHISIKSLIGSIENAKEGETDGFLRRLTKMYSDGKLTEFQISDLLEQYCILHPQIFSIQNSGEEISELRESLFTDEVFALFSSNCPPIIDLISQITVYSSAKTVQKVMKMLLHQYNSKLIPSSVIDFVENAVAFNSSRCRHLPLAEQSVVLFDYVLAELLRRFDENIVTNTKESVSTSANKTKSEKFKKLSQTEMNFNKFNGGINDIVVLSQPILSQFLRILTALFEESETETYVEQEYETENARKTLKALQKTVNEYERRLKWEDVFSNEQQQKLKAVELISETIDNKFPGFSQTIANKVSSITLNVSEINLLSNANRKHLWRPIELLSINDFDVLLHRTITELFGLITNDFYSSNNNAIRLSVKSNQTQQLTVLSGTTTDMIIEIMKNLVDDAKLKPHVMSRQIPLLSNFVLSVMQKSTRQFRDSPIFAKVLELTPDIVYYCCPHSMKDAHSIEFILQAYYTFFETYGYRRAWTEIAEKCLRCSLKILEFNFSLACKLFSKNAHILRILIAKTNSRIPEAHALLKNISLIGTIGNDCDIKTINSRDQTTSMEIS